jgi:hypothetical protein
MLADPKYQNLKPVDTAYFDIKVSSTNDIKYGWIEK